jgi:glycosyltransferase involved in cell wall biosynthesis
MSHFIMLTLEYPPDPGAEGQLFEDAAVRLAERGHRVTVYTGELEGISKMDRRSDASRHGKVRVVRLPWTRKRGSSLPARLLVQFIYLTHVFHRLFFKRQVGGVVLTSIPPTTGVMYLSLRAFRKFPTLYWVMDVNPDRAVVLGVAGEGSLGVRVLNRVNAKLFCGSQSVVVMDRFMRQRVLRKRYIQDHQCAKVEIIPPWPLTAHLYPVPRDENTFLTAHHLEDKRCVFMYSGQHNPVNPLATFLQAIKSRRNRNDLSFLFVGGGKSKPEVERTIKEERLVNARSLPWQPIPTLSFSLSAADVHVVVMGDDMAGIVHPCKIYNAMAVGKPILFIGPLQSHLGELVSLCGIGWVAAHGEPGRLADLIDEIAAMPRDERAAIGARGKALIEGTYNPDALAGKFVELVESLVPRP